MLATFFISSFYNFASYCVMHEFCFFVCPSQSRCLSVEAADCEEVTVALTSAPTSPSLSRPASTPLSRQNSSGYGSTRSKAEPTSLGVEKLSTSNPDLGFSPELLPTPARVEGRQSRKLSASTSAPESQTLPRVQGRKYQRPTSSVNIIKPLEISRQPFVISPPPKAPHKTITLQKTEKIVTTVSIQNITNSNYKKPPPPVPPPGRPLLPPSMLQLPKRTISTPKSPAAALLKVSPSSSSSCSSYTSDSSSAASTSTVRQFHSLQRPIKCKEKPSSQFYSLRRSNSSETKLLPASSSAKLMLAKSTPNIAREAKAPIPTPRSLKVSLSFSNSSSPIARVLFCKPLYQNVPVRISPNIKDEPLTEQVRAATPPSVVSLCPKPVASWTLFLWHDSVQKYLHLHQTYNTKIAPYIKHTRRIALILC